MNQIILLEQMGRAFNDNGVRDLCYVLDIDYDDLLPGGKRDKLRELILHCERIGRLPKLIEACRRLQPTLAWPEPETVFDRQQLVGEKREVPETISKAVSELWSRYGKATRESLSGKMNEIEWSQGVERYYSGLYQRVGFVRILGRHEAEPLSNVFTHVNVLDRVSAELRYDIEQMSEDFPPRKVNKRSGFKPLSGEEAVLKYSKLFILGKPGAGKTTFLKHTALQAIRHNIQKVPIFISLKELSDSKFGIMTFIVNQFHTYGFVKPASFIEEMLHDGRGLVLFDGLDEVNLEREQRANLIRKLNDFVYQYNDCSILLTCRVAATDYTFTQFVYVEMADFDSEQMKRYINHWFADDRIKRESCYQALLRNEANEAVRELAQVPLLLSLLCLVFEERNEFPPNRDEVYEEAVRALLLKWDASRNISRDIIYRQLSYKHKVRLLTYIAKTTFEAGQYFLPQKQVVGLLEKALAKVPGIREPDGEMVLRAMEAQHGIFVERALYIHSFSHLTLQEYFTAKYIVDNEARGTLIGLLLHIEDRRWREVFLLTAGMLDDATEFFRLFIESVEELIADEIEISRLLNQVSIRSFGTDDTVKPSALRAFDLNIYARASGKAYESALGLARDLADTRSNKDDRTQARTRALDRDLARIMAYGYVGPDSCDPNKINSIFINVRKWIEKLELTELQIVLEPLSLLPQGSTQTTCQNFIKQLRQICIKHRDIGHPWTLSVKQTELLGRYLEASRLLIACLNLATVGKVAREEFENRLLLPPRE